MVNVGFRASTQPTRLTSPAEITFNQLPSHRIVIVILWQRPNAMNMVGKQNKSANAKWVVSSHMQKCLFYQRRVCFVTQNLIPPISHDRKKEGCPRCF